MKITSVDLRAIDLRTIGVLFIIWGYYYYSSFVTIVAIKYENNKLFILQFFSWKEIDINNITNFDSNGTHFYINKCQHYNLFKRFTIPSFGGKDGELIAKALSANHDIKYRN